MAIKYHKCDSCKFRITPANNKPCYDCLFADNFEDANIDIKLFRAGTKRVIVTTKHGTKYSGVLKDIDFRENTALFKTDVGEAMVGLSVITSVEVDDEEPTNGMSPDVFKNLLEELDGNSVKTLAEKNARYASNGDCLHNFRSGGDILGGTPAQACWGYLTKHLVALRDMVERNDFSNREDFLEKCQDSINYIRFLWCIGNDTNNNEKENE